MLDQEESIDRRELEQKHYSQSTKLSIGTLLTLIATLATVFMWVSKAESNIAVHGAEIRDMRDKIEQNQMLAERDRGEILARLEKISDKLDKLK